MKKTTALTFLQTICFLFCGNVYGGDVTQKDTLTQISTYQGLMESILDGETPIKDLKQYGDFGLGTYNGLDGEMLVIDGFFYQMAGDGTVRQVDDSMKTPFATVTFFETDRTVQLHAIENYDSFREEADKNISTPNIFYAIKIKGVFKAVKTRSFPKQSKPYPAAREMANIQTILNFENIKGTMVGFRSPSYVGVLNSPGYHFHFMTDDRKAGGHVLEFSIREAIMEMDETSRWSVILPSDEVFYSADFAPKN